MSARYPVLFGQTEEFHEARRKAEPYPRSVPWELVKDHEAQARRNHSQTLDHLASRGGLSPKEIWCIVHDKNFYSDEARTITEADAIEWLRGIDGVTFAVPGY